MYRSFIVIIIVVFLAAGCTHTSSVDIKPTTNDSLEASLDTIATHLPKTYIGTWIERQLSNGQYYSETIINDTMQLTFTYDTAHKLMVLDNGGPLWLNAPTLTEDAIAIHYDFDISTDNPYTGHYSYYKSTESLYYHGSVGGISYIFTFAGRAL